MVAVSPSPRAVVVVAARAVVVVAARAVVVVVVVVVVAVSPSARVVAVVAARAVVVVAVPPSTIAVVAVAAVAGGVTVAVATTGDDCACRRARDGTLALGLGEGPMNDTAGAVDLVVVGATVVLAGSMAS